MADEYEKSGIAKQLAARFHAHMKKGEQGQLVPDPQASWSRNAIKFGLPAVYTCCCYNPFCPGTSKSICADHVIPRHRDLSTDDLGNLQPLCIDCNSTKFTEEIDFRRCWQNSFKTGRIGGQLPDRPEPAEPEPTEDDFRQDRKRSIGNPYGDD